MSQEKAPQSVVTCSFINADVGYVVIVYSYANGDILPLTGSYKAVIRHSATTNKAIGLIEIDLAAWCIISLK